MHTICRECWVTRYVNNLNAPAKTLASCQGMNSGYFGTNVISVTLRLQQQPVVASLKLAEASLTLILGLLTPSIAHRVHDLFPGSNVVLLRCSLAFWLDALLWCLQHTVCI